MAISKKEVNFIDNWLINQGIKFIDIRYELLDHLVTEFENSNDSRDLGAFLNTRRGWCKNFLKEKQKAINNGVSKALLKKMSGFFISPKSIILLLFFGAVLYLLKSTYGNLLTKDILIYTYLIFMVYQIGLMIFSGFGQRLKNDSISVRYLFNTFTISQLPFINMWIIPDGWWFKVWFYIPYLGLGILLSIASILVYHEKRAALLEEFDLIRKGIK